MAKRTGDSIVSVTDLSPPTTIMSLPPELLDFILSSCTNSALLALSQTCKGLHAIALHTFFKRNKIQDPVNGWLFARDVPKETLDAVRVALFVKKLSMIDWHLNPGWQCKLHQSVEEDGTIDEQGICSCLSESVSESRTHLSDAGLKMGPLKRTFDEVANLRAIVTRLGNIVSVSLHFFEVDVWVMDEAPKYSQTQLRQVPWDLWRTYFLGLLDTLLDKGCEKLYIGGGHRMKYLYQHDTLGVEDEVYMPVTDEAARNRHEGANRDAKQARKQIQNRLLGTRFSFRPLLNFFHFITKASDKRKRPTFLDLDSTSADTATVQRQPKLKELRVHSDMLLLPPFDNWTLSLLSPSFPSFASTLTRLSFSPGSTFLPSPFLTTAHLPNLTDFKAAAPFIIRHRGGETGRANFEDIVGFLRRHSTQLEKVYLYGAALPAKPSHEAFVGSTSTATSSLDKPDFPHLRSFSAHPAYIMWLLEPAISVPPACNKKLPNLTSISITSEHYNSTPDFQYPLFDEALEALVRFCSYRKGEMGPKVGKEKQIRKENSDMKTIELTLGFASENGISEWFASHLQASHTPSILTQLIHISTLTISAFHFVEFSEQTVNILPDWLALISNASNSSSSARGSRTPSTLQRVKFIDFSQEGFPGEGLDQGLFVKRVAEKCVGLKELQFDREPIIDLDKVRAEC
ncbi:hypothetical protein GALMADRAFT_426127 [Galerina marginata CBS 339.88]|uniref:F-box domain-containing protein n=1 Tax=Galerina marginata (strain CBS 339.88) TaxID=685588 RepID=A0A067TDI2_GALM3|nr:hypothetical protein GALMADRAFT_426127 [Galerina marginata CBS 339.88]